MRRTLTALVIGCSLAGERRAAADDASEAVRVTHVTLGGDGNEVALAGVAIVEQLERLGIRITLHFAPVTPSDVRVASEAAHDDVLARAWLDFGGPTEVTLYVVDGRRHRVLVRRFPRDGRNELAREEAMVALQTVMDALLHGEAIGTSAADAKELPESPPALPAPAPPTPSPPAIVVALAAGYEVGAFAAGAVEQGPITSLHVARVSDTSAFSFSVSGQYRLPIASASAPASLRVDSGAVRSALGARLFAMRSSELWLHAGGGIDVIRADPRLDGVSDATLTPIARLDPIGRVEGDFRLHFTGAPSMALRFAVGLDIAPASRPFAVRRAGVETALLDPSVVRPFAVVGFLVP